jgi:hypothetical protein
MSNAEQAREKAVREAEQKLTDNWVKSKHLHRDKIAILNWLWDSALESAGEDEQG